MSEDGVNRNDAFEIVFISEAKKNYQENVELSCLYRIWLDLRCLDLKLARAKRFRTMTATMHLAGIAVHGTDNDVYWEYMNWFMLNRVINSGHQGHAVCERNTIFVRPKEKD
jgi:hypothetical protein